MTGDQQDFLARLKSLLPNGWFVDPVPVLDGLLNAAAALFADAYAFIQYARTQTRVKTATDGFLDLIAIDFFDKLRRRANESNESLRKRILAQLFLEKGTRYGLTRALEILTGRTPTIFEPARPADTGGLNLPVMGLNAAGGIGSLLHPHQAFVTAYRPLGQGIPNIPGLNTPAGGLNTPGSAVASLAMIEGQVTDLDIFETISQTLPVASVAWVRIAS